MIFVGQTGVSKGPFLEQLDRKSHEMAFTFNKIVRSGEETLVTVTAQPEDWRAAAAVIEDFVERADAHLASYASVQEEQARALVQTIQAAVNDNQTDIEMSELSFRRMSILLHHYHSHGYGSLKAGHEAPITEAEWKRLSVECDAAVEELEKSMG